MTNVTEEEINVLRLTLHASVVGYVVGFRHGRNTLIFADEFRYNPERPTFTLATGAGYPNADKLMMAPWSTHQKLHPVLSNLLPEGSLRDWIAQALKIHFDNEFHLLTSLGMDLPGALIAEPLAPEQIPANVLAVCAQGKPVKFSRIANENKFSLAGVQMKFSMKRSIAQRGERYTLSSENVLGDWIVKTPSTIHKHVPANEFTAMTLASLIGIQIPEITLVDLDRLDNLPPINLPNEKFAFAIKRFDRENNERIHMEDFAQVFFKYAHEKYHSANYEQIGKIISAYSGSGLEDLQQFARRLLVNILLANGDAHLKNWSLLYSDRVTPRLSPAYDILTTSVYISGERNYALNLGKNKDWYTVSYANFEYWSKKAGVPWRAIKAHLNDAMDKARTLWPAALGDLPMNEDHKNVLRQHWASLHSDFVIRI